MVKEARLFVTVQSIVLQFTSSRLMKLGQEVEKEKEGPRHREDVYILLDLVSWGRSVGPRPGPVPGPLYGGGWLGGDCSHPHPLGVGGREETVPALILRGGGSGGDLLLIFIVPPFVVVVFLAGPDLPIRDYGPTGALSAVCSTEGLLQPGLPHQGLCP